MLRFNAASKGALDTMTTGLAKEDLAAFAGVTLLHRDGRFVWRDEVFQRFPLTIDAPPGESKLTELLSRSTRMPVRAT